MRPCVRSVEPGSSRATLERFGELMVVCSQCKAALLGAERSGDAWGYAREMSAILSRHCLIEKRSVMEALARTDLTHIQPHSRHPELFWPDGRCGRSTRIFRASP